MVTLSERFKTLWTLDLCGFGAAASILGFGLWFGLLKEDSAGKRIGEVRAIGTQQVTDLKNLRQQIQQQELIRDGQIQAVEEKGALPTESFIDRDLAAITTVARNNGLAISDVTPQQPINYSGVLEQRYSIHLVGKFPDYVRFMDSFERTDCWADITSLSLRADKALTQNPDEQVGQLAVSFFSVQRDPHRPPPAARQTGGPS